MKNRTLIATALTLALASPMAFAGNAPQDSQNMDRTVTTEATAERPDAWVLTKVKAQFAGSGTVDATDINVDVQNGTVHLRGTVANSTERQEAIRIAQTTEGVKNVQDMLTVSNETQGGYDQNNKSDRDKKMPKSK